jgi:hypothetical protein
MLEETTKQICELGDLTHDYAIQLAQMVDARNAEIKRLQQENERYKEQVIKWVKYDDSNPPEMGKWFWVCSEESDWDWENNVDVKTKRTQVGKLIRHGKEVIWEDDFDGLDIHNVTYYAEIIYP